MAGFPMSSVRDFCESSGDTANRSAILQVLGINPNLPQAVLQEKTQVLPDLITRRE